MSKKGWWQQSPEKIYESVFSHVDGLARTQKYRTEMNLRHLRLYGNMEVMGLDPNTYSKTLKPGNPTDLKINVIQSVIDTVGSRIGNEKPKPMTVTKQSDFRWQRMAEDLSQFGEGLIYDTDTYEKGKTVFLDAEVFGDGHFKIIEKSKGRIGVERAFPEEIKIDDREAWGGMVLQKHQVKYLHRDWVIDKFCTKTNKSVDIKKLREFLKNTEPASQLHFGVTDSSIDMLKVVESWRLPYADGKGGRHAISVSNATCFQEEYKSFDFPLIDFKIGSRILGMNGQGFAEKLTPIQVELNKLLRTVQLCLHLHGIPKVLMPLTESIPASHFSPEIGIIMKYKTVKPEIWSGNVLNAEIYAQIDRLYHRAFEIAGVTELSATGRKPDGLDSGAALRTYNDIETVRFKTIETDWHQCLSTKLMHKFIEKANEIYNRDKEFKVKAVGKRYMKEINWKDVKEIVDKGWYYIQPYPVSSLPSHPAARRQRLVEEYQAGLITREQYQDLTDNLDLDFDRQLQKASRDYVRELISKIIYDGKYISPDKYTDLDFGMKYAQQQYNRSMLENVPEGRVELLRQWIDEAADRIREQTMQMTAGMQPGNGQPIASPQAPPVSDEVPYTTTPGGSNVPGTQ